MSSEIVAACCCDSGPCICNYSSIQLNWSGKFVFEPIDCAEAFNRWRAGNGVNVCAACCTFMPTEKIVWGPLNCTVPMNNASNCSGCWEREFEVTFWRYYNTLCGFVQPTTTAAEWCAQDFRDTVYYSSYPMTLVGTAKITAPKYLGSGQFGNRPKWRVQVTLGSANIIWESVQDYECNLSALTWVIVAPTNPSTGQGYCNLPNPDQYPDFYFSCGDPCGQRCDSTYSGICDPTPFAPPPPFVWVGCGTPGGFLRCKLVGDSCGSVTLS